MLTLVLALWRGKIAIIIAVIICVSAAAAYALTATEWWRAEVVAVRVDADRLSGNLGTLGGLASLAGIDIASNSSSAEPMAVLRSRDLVRHFIVDEGLVQGILDQVNPDGALAAPAGGEVAEADVRDAAEFFSKNMLTIGEDKSSGTVHIGVRWTDPASAADWANKLVDAANERLRSRAQADAERNIRFLRAEMLAANVPALQQSLSRVLESEIQKLLLSRGNQEFAFRVIDRAVPPKYRHSPKRTLIVMAAGLLGACLGALFVLVLAAIRGINR